MAPKPTTTTSTDVLDEIVEAVEGSYAAADALLADAAEASMVPEGLVGSEVDEYLRASQIVARFLAEFQTPKLAFPVAAGPDDLGVETMAAAYKKFAACSDALAIEETVRTISGMINAQTPSGALIHQQARIIASSEANDPTGVRLWIVEWKPGTSLTKGGETPYALIALYPIKTYPRLDRTTGELSVQVDTGKVTDQDRGRKIPNQVAVWAGNGGIVRMLSKAEGDRLALDWLWQGSEVENTAWAISACRRLERLSDRRSAVRPDVAEREPVADVDPFSAPF